MSFLLEKPVLFDVTERSTNNRYYASVVLEKPVLFDVTEPCTVPQVWKSAYKLEKPVLFDVTEHLSVPAPTLKTQLEKPVLFDVTELFWSCAPISLYVGKAGFIWCHGTRNEAFFNEIKTVGKAGFIWCHGTRRMSQKLQRSNCWKSRFYLMSRNFWVRVTICTRKSVGKAGFIWCHGTERWENAWKHHLFVGKAGFIWCHGTGGEQRFKGYLCWKSRFYLMSRNIFRCILRLRFRVGKAGFIWCHGTKLLPVYFCKFLLEKPVLFDVTERGRRLWRLEKI